MYITLSNIGYSSLEKHNTCCNFYRRVLPIIILLLIFQQALSQSNNPGIDKVFDFPNSFFNKVNQNTTKLEERLTKQTSTYLQRLAKREKKIQRKLSKIDSAGAQQLFAGSEAQYQQLTNKIKGKTSKLNEAMRGEYLPGMDSLKTSLAFLQQNNQLLGNAKEIQQKAQGAMGNVTQLQSRLQQSEQVKAFIQQRKQQIKEALGKYTKLPKGISNSLTDFNKEVYYYGQQLREYKDMLKDPDKMVQKGLTLLNKLPAFKQFMAQHSELASLFRLPDNYGTPQSLAGLQTRAQVQQQIQTQLASAGPNAQQYLQQNIQAAQAQLNKLKDKISKLGGNGGSDMDMPDFKPNNQKTKSFWKRLEYGTNIQSAKSSYFFPTTTDIGLSVGYKINDKSTIGVGSSYKMGWGKDIRNISITSQGAGFRSFFDMKIKGSFYGSGGFEYNYQPLNDSVSTAGGITAKSWQQSGLIGVSKVISIKSKFFKKTRMQLLWDFLSYRQVPRTQPVKFRVGYNF
jgi:hypothetical protein